MSQKAKKDQECVYETAKTLRKLGVPLYSVKKKLVLDIEKLKSILNNPHQP